MPTPCLAAAVRRPVLVLLVGLLAAPAAAVRAPDEPVVQPDLDVRLSRNARYQAVVALQNGVKPAALIAGPRAEPGELRQAALAALERGTGPLVVRWDEITGSPHLLFARAGALTGPDARPADVVAREFLQAHRNLFLLDADEVKDLRVSRVVGTSAGGSVVRFEQSILGVDVLHGHLAVSVTRDGRVLHVMGGHVASGMGLEPKPPASTPAQALGILAAMAGVHLSELPQPLRADAHGAAFRVKELRGDVTVRRTVFPTFGGPRWGWTADVFVAGSPAGYELTVDDATLAPVRRASRTWFADTRGRVFVNNPGDSPHELVRFADGADYRRDASPVGWADEAVRTPSTVGNNTVVQDDIANDDDATPGVRGQVSGGPSPWWAFDHPFTTGGPADQQASLTNLFYAINMSHDRFYDLGFDERSGNFQASNLGRGGLEGDPVMGDDMDGSGTNNANFQTPPDGQPGRMQMYLWDGSGTERSSSLETGVVIHEFGHGVSTRLVGGPDDVSCLFGAQGGSMGEGWSDYFAGSFLDDTVIAEWVSGDPAGIRMFRLDENPPTGKDYRDFCTYGNDLPPRLCEPHDNGEIWSGFLWLIREDYVARYGPVDGPRRADQLVVDALKYTPCSPSMLDARDALILADRLETGGENECAIKAIAASRWMGANASSNGGNDAEPVAGNAPWPECVSAGSLRFDRDGLEGGAVRARYGCQDTVGIVLTDGNYAPAADSVTLVVLRAAVEVDRETVSPVAGAGPGVFEASIPASGGVGTPDDGLLQVQDGDEIEATYADANPAGGVAVARADVTCTPRLGILRHRVVNGSCDADAVPGYPDLPGFVDKGETADVLVEVANLMPFAVTGSMTVTTTRPDLVTVLPTSPFPVSFPAAVGTAPASIVVALTVVGSGTITPGDVADVQFTLQASQFSAPVVAATLPLELGMDYEVEAGLTQSFDMEGESAPAGPAWSRGELNPGVGNQWTLVTCRNTTTGGTKAFRNGPANCSGRYSDSQGNPWLASPPLTLYGPATRAARIVSAEWQNDINLGVIGFPPNIPLALDADAVVVTATNDPTTFDASDPITAATTALAFYIRVDIPGFYSQDSNTTGWVLDHRDVAPGQLTGVDLSQPVRLAWYFLPDITFVQPPLDAQGNGYYLDDVLVTFERVNAVPRDEIVNPPCTPTVAVHALPVVATPAGAVGCAGSLVTVDASLSESALCGPPATLDYRFLVGGAPVACLEVDGITPRTQDAEGWGASATCSERPAGDRTYDVEVRCAVMPAATDGRPVTVRIVDGLPLVSGSERAFCAGAASRIVLDASGSSLVGCPGPAEYAWSDGTGPLDCDGDGAPDGFGTDPTCMVGPSDVALDVTLSIRCSTLPACALTDTFTIPAVSATAVATEGSTAPGGFYCPGSSATLDAGGSVITGCTGGQEQYRWTSSLGFDSGWVGTPALDVTVTTDEDFSLQARCSLSPSCVSAPDGPVSLLARTGAFSFSFAAEPEDCAGDLFELRGGVRNPPGVRCAGTVEYRFLSQQPGPSYAAIPCFDDAAGTPRTEDVDGWGAGASCWTPHVAGGGDFVIQYRCGDDPSCVIETSTPRTISPQTGIPAGSTLGTLRVRKSAPGCPSGGDVRVFWADTDFVPLTFVLYRADDVPLDPAADRLANVDDFAYLDVGAACDGGGVPYRGATVYFYLHSGRNSCTNDPIP